MRARLQLILSLGATQTLAWASSYYLPAFLAAPAARELGVSTTHVFAAFSASLVVSAVLGPRIGRLIDLGYGRGVLIASHVVLAAGLAGLGLAQGVAGLWAAWLALGVGMGLGLYDAAFAVLSRLYGARARGPITGVTLMAGFASTIGWPLTAWGVEAIGWRETCFAWGLAHLALGLPLAASTIPRPPPLAMAATRAKLYIPFNRTMLLLAFAFASAWMVTSAMAAHLPCLLEASGATATQAVAAGALVGPAQVAARMVEARFLVRYHPLLSARLAAVMHPIGAAVLALFGGAATAGVFAFLHGAGNGVLTIARGTVPLAVFGPDNYGYRLGLIGAPARLAQAAAPLLFGFLVDALGAGALIVSSALSLAALGALAMVRERRPPGHN